MADITIETVEGGAAEAPMTHPIDLVRGKAGSAEPRTISNLTRQVGVGAERDIFALLAGYYDRAENDIQKSRPANMHAVDLLAKLLVTDGVTIKEITSCGKIPQLMLIALRGFDFVLDSFSNWTITDAVRERYRRVTGGYANLDYAIVGVHERNSPNADVTMTAKHDAAGEEPFRSEMRERYENHGGLDYLREEIREERRAEYGERVDHMLLRIVDLGRLSADDMDILAGLEGEM